MTVTVRKAEIRDLGSIGMIYRLNRVPLGRSRTPDELRLMLGNPIFVIHVAEADGRVTAFGILEERSYPDRHLYLDNTASDPRLSVDGDAHAINVEREEEARRRGISVIRGAISVSNERSVRFYESSGYEIEPAREGVLFRPISKTIT